MKKLLACIMAATLLLASFPVQLKAEAIPTSLVSTGTLDPAEAKALLTRLDEINRMDKSKMSSSEKKELRKEVRTIKKNLDNGGAYISVGGLIIILLLLIILL